MISSRLVPLFREYEASPTVSAVILASSTPSPHGGDNSSYSNRRAIDDDDFDDDFVASKKEYSLELPILKTQDGKSLLLPLAPHIPIRACHSLATTLVSQLASLKLSNAPHILIVSPTGGASSGIVGNGDNSLAFLQTSAAKPIPALASTYTQLAPPQAIQGPPAAILSAAETYCVPATALVIGAEGPLDHEQTSPDGLLTVAHVLKSLYGLSNILSTLPSQSYRMYL